MSNNDRHERHDLTDRRADEDAQRHWVIMRDVEAIQHEHDVGHYNLADQQAKQPFRIDAAVPARVSLIGESFVLIVLLEVLGLRGLLGCRECGL